MAVTLVFIIMIILAIITIFISALLSTIGAVDAFDSAWFNTAPNLRTAHQYLTISAAMSWATLTILIIIVIVAACMGNFSVPQLNKTNTGDNRRITNEYTKSFAESNSTYIILLVVMVLLALSNIAYGILQLLATLDISSLTVKDSHASNAYTMALVASIMSLLSLIFLCIACVAYYMIYRGNQKFIAAINEKPSPVKETVEDEDSDTDAETPSLNRRTASTTSQKQKSPLNDLSTIVTKTETIDYEE